MRFQVNLGDDVVKRLDAVCDKLGVARSSYCAMKIAEAVELEEKKDDIFKAYSESMMQILNETAKTMISEKK